MGTHCKLIFGYTDHCGWWNETQSFYRHYDGYKEAIIPLLQKHISALKNGLETTEFVNLMNLDAEYDEHKFEELENSHDYGTVDYVYYIDASNRAKIQCTVLCDDLEFSKHYGCGNYKVDKELIL